MIISNNTRTVHIILLTVFLSGSNTNFSKIILIINISTQAKPCATCHRNILIFIQPAVVDTHNHGISKHCRTRCPCPKVWSGNQLIPKTVLVHVFLQMIHHQQATCHDTCTIKILFWLVIK